MMHQIASVIKNNARIAILPHVSADGDALGSSLALALALEKMGKQIRVFLEEEIPSSYSFLPGVRLSDVYAGKLQTFDVAVALDTGDMERLGKRAELFHAARMTVNIDHHPTNTLFGFHNYVRTEAAAVGEIMHELIGLLGQELDQGISTCLYVAIATDTGGFRYSNTTAATHRIAADLISNGVKVAETSQRIFETTSMEKVRLLGLAANSLELLENGKVACIALSEDGWKAIGAKDEDFDGVVNLGRNIGSVEIAVMFRQQGSNEVKVNLRSKAYADVSAIANLFGGGGHKRAAGCTVKGRLQEIRAMVLEDIRTELYKIR